MNYELAVKLKKVGFKQTGTSGKWFDSGAGTKMTAYEPALSELIEACGDVFRWLKHIPKGKPEQKWMAQGRPHWKDESGKGLKEPRCFGSTPEEAVANLWLKLNE